MRFQQPRDLEAHETADSLEHWMNQLEVYLKRDPTLSVFLEEDWDPSAAHYALEAKAGEERQRARAREGGAALGGASSPLAPQHVQRDRAR